MSGKEGDSRTVVEVGETVLRVEEKVVEDQAIEEDRVVEVEVEEEEGAEVEEGAEEEEGVEEETSQRNRLLLIMAMTTMMMIIIMEMMHMMNTMMSWREGQMQGELIEIYSFMNKHDCTQCSL